MKGYLIYEAVIISAIFGIIAYQKSDIDGIGAFLIIMLLIAGLYLFYVHRKEKKDD